MFTARRLRQATAIAVTTALLTLGAVAVSSQATTPSYPIDHGVVTITTTINGSAQRLQETGNPYHWHSAARNVAITPASWNSVEHEWHLVQVGENQYRFIGASGRALQRTGNAEWPGGATNVVTSPASWNSSEQIWTMTGVTASEWTVNIVSPVAATAAEGTLTPNSAPYYPFLEAANVQAGTGTITTSTNWTVAFVNGVPPAPRLSMETTRVNVPVNPFTTTTLRFDGSLGRASTLSWDLAGPLAPLHGSCHSLNWIGAPTWDVGSVAVTADGELPTSWNQLSTPGCYSYSLTLAPTGAGDVVRVGFGVDQFTVLVP